MNRRDALGAGTAASLWPALAALPASAIAQAVTGRKVARLSFPAAETGFDPAQINDLYSNTVLSHIMEAPLQYDFLARPAKLIVRTAAAMPEVSSDFRTYTVRIKPGIFFTDDPAFKGKRRELVAADYVYQFKRIFDPRWKSPFWSQVSKAPPIGLPELRKQAQEPGGRFDYDREIEGLRTLDRYTFQIKLRETDPRFIYNLADVRPFGAVAREVVEAASTEAELMGRPVGTGPFKLVQWRRASLIALERNPEFREEIYACEAPADDPRSQQIAQQLKGKRVPFVDRIEYSIIEQTQPQWLAFLQGQLDLGGPGELLNTAAPQGRLAPALAKRGIWMERLLSPDVVASYFNMTDPLVGGYTPDKVALRRAISLGYDLGREIRDVRRGQMIPANSPVPPNTFGFDTGFVSEMSEYDPVRANALLDTFGYKDVNGDGWREQPDGQPLVIEQATQGDDFSRQSNEVWKKSMDAIGIRMNFNVGQWPEQLKSARAGKLQMWALGWSATAPDGETFFDIAYGPSIGTANLARFERKEFDRLFDEQRVMGDTPERLARMREMKRLLATYVPYKFHGHRIVNTFVHPWLVGYRRHPYLRETFKWVDIDTDLRDKSAGKA
jgi:ABC-type transport system substrate-binding protein